MRRGLAVDVAVLILALGVAVCLVTIFMDAALDDTPIAPNIANLVFAAFGGVIGILGATLADRHAGGHRIDPCADIEVDHSPRPPEPRA